MAIYRHKYKRAEHLSGPRLCDQVNTLTSPVQPRPRDFPCGLSSAFEGADSDATQDAPRFGISSHDCRSPDVAGVAVASVAASLKLATLHICRPATNASLGFRLEELPYRGVPLVLQPRCRSICRCSKELMSPTIPLFHGHYLLRWGFLKLLQEPMDQLPVLPPHDSGGFRFLTPKPRGKLPS